MSESLALAFALLLILAGLFFLFYIVANRLLYKTGSEDFYTVVLGKEGDEELPDKVYAAFVQANTLNFSANRFVCVVDLGIGEELKRKCERAVEGFGKVVFLHGEAIGSEDEYIVICLDKE